MARADREAFKTIIEVARTNRFVQMILIGGLVLAQQDRDKTRTKREKADERRKNNAKRKKSDQFILSDGGGNGAFRASYVPSSHRPKKIDTHQMDP